MFSMEVYRQRRIELREKIGSGTILIPGNPHTPRNYRANTNTFRQDSSFLYYTGLDHHDLFLLIDVDEGTEWLFGDDYTIDQIVWMGPQPTVASRAERCGISGARPLSRLKAYVKSSLGKGRQIHIPPQYQPANTIFLADLFDTSVAGVQEHVSEPLIRAIVSQRSYKTDIELAEIEKALDVSHEMHVAAMRNSRPGLTEKEIVGQLRSIAYAHTSCPPAYEVIFSIHGETLHNHYHGNVMKEGNIVLNDSGAESAMHYASDITRTFPVDGKFTSRQRDIYEIVLQSENAGLAALAPGVKFRDIHLLCARILLEGLKDLGCVKGNIDDAMEQGVYGLFFQCGVGHMMGLDVHDMEGLGEQYVGYDDGTERSKQFGICYLRMARALEPGFVMTVEPGIYFIPELIDRWSGERKFVDFVDYHKVKEYRDFGGVRIEDNAVITDSGHRVLGKPIPKTVAEVEAACAND